MTQRKSNEFRPLPPSAEGITVEVYDGAGDVLRNAVFPLSAVIKPVILSYVNGMPAGATARVSYAFAWGRVDLATPDNWRGLYDAIDRVTDHGVRGEVWP